MSENDYSDQQLEDLYQEVILDHAKNPRNFKKLSNPTCESQGHNPLCGDRLTVFIKKTQDRVSEISFEGSGCAISTASASLMTEILKDKTLQSVEALFQSFHQLVTGKLQGENLESLGKLAVFKGVAEFPARVKCASLAWHTMHKALLENASSGPVSTEGEKDPIPGSGVADPRSLGGGLA